MSKRRMNRIADLTIPIGFVERNVALSWSLLEALMREQLLKKRDLLDFFARKLSLDEDLRDSLLNVLILDDPKMEEISAAIATMRAMEKVESGFAERQLLHLVLKFLWETQDEFEDPLVDLEIVYFDLHHPEEMKHLLRFSSMSANESRNFFSLGGKPGDHNLYHAWQQLIQSSELLMKDADQDRR